MGDPNLKDFNGRLRRIDKIHRAGGGFEAAGTLGMSYYTAVQRRRSRKRLLVPLALVLLTILVIKGFVYAQVGALSYQARIDTLRVGSTADRIGAYVLQADPLTKYIAGVIEGTN